MCEKPELSFNHLAVLSLTIYFFDFSVTVIMIYWVFGLYVLLTFYIAEKFPNEVGPKYLDFLKRHSSPGAFEMYCGNSWRAIKLAARDPEIFGEAARNVSNKLIAIIFIYIAMYLLKAWLSGTF